MCLWNTIPESHAGSQGQGYMIYLTFVSPVSSWPKEVQTMNAISCKSKVTGKRESLAYTGLFKIMYETTL